MRAVAGTLFALALILWGGVTVHAQEASVTYSQEAPPADAVTVDWGADANGSDANVEDESAQATPAGPSADIALPAAAAVPLVSPIASETVEEDGKTLVKQTYDVSPEGLIESAFEQDGLRFTLRDIQTVELPGETASIPAVKTAVTLTGSDDSAVVLAQFPATIRHEEDGYTGQLSLVASSLTTRVEEWDSYSYTRTESEEVGALDRNDPSLLEKERDGMELAGITFDSERETQVGDSLVPSSYSATLTWQSTVSGSNPIRYLSTAEYTGQITKTIPGDTLYTVVYEAAPIQAKPEPITSAPDPDPVAPLPELEEDSPVEETAPAVDEEPAPEEDMAEDTDGEETEADAAAFPFLPLLIGESVLVVVLLALLVVRHRKVGRDLD